MIISPIIAQAFPNDPIAFTLFPDDQTFEADAALVLGISAWHRPVARAVSIYRQGLARKLVFTGGFNARMGVVEARTMADAAAARGVDRSDMLIEPEATNTLENMQFSRRLLETELGIAHSGRLIIIAIHFHIRRAVMTARRIFPPGIEIGWASYPSRFYSSGNWQASERGRRDVKSEVAKIRLYFGEDVPVAAKSAAA